MLKKTITYTDYDGNVRNEDFYFNLTKAELMEMDLAEAGGLEEMLTRIISLRDTAKIISVFKDIILKSVGIKSPDGRKFIKNQEIRDDFSQTEAFSDLYMEHDSNGNFVIPEGKLFVMGDNRVVSLDSRNEKIGMIDVKDVIGKAQFVAWPFNHFGYIYD